MRYLRRNKEYTKIEPTKDAKKIYIFCEGARREVDYFKYFQGFSSVIELTPIPCQHGKSDPVKLMERAVTLFDSKPPQYTLSEEYGDEVWFVIDTDEWHDKGYITILLNFCDQKNTSERPVWNICQSNPSFEIWLYYHFHDYKPDSEEIAQAASFKDFVGNKIEGGFDSTRMPCLLGEANENSFKNYIEQNQQPIYLTTAVHKLGLVIYPYVKDQLNIIIQASKEAHKQRL